MIQRGLYDRINIIVSTRVHKHIMLCTCLKTCRFLIRIYEILNKSNIKPELCYIEIHKEVSEMSDIEI